MNRIISLLWFKYKKKIKFSELKTGLKYLLKWHINKHLSQMIIPKYLLRSPLLKTVTIWWLI